MLSLSSQGRGSLARKLLYAFGQANPAPTADDGIGRFSFDTLPFYFNVS